MVKYLFEIEVFSSFKEFEELNKIFEMFGEAGRIGVSGKFGSITMDVTPKDSGEEAKLTDDQLEEVRKILQEVLSEKAKSHPQLTLTVKKGKLTDGRNESDNGDPADGEGSNDIPADRKRDVAKGPSEKVRT